jgi:hypothetical protein
MTIYQFTLLDEMEQMEAIWDAVDVGQYEDDVYLYKCYQINDFYVETKKHKEHGVFHAIKTFRNPALLDLYLNLGNK